MTAGEVVYRVWTFGRTDSVSSRTVRLLSIAAFVILAIIALSVGGRDDRWQPDEGYRISGTYFLRLFQRGDVSHSDWFRVVADSAHVPGAEYLFGLAIRLHGLELPHDLALRRYYDAGGLAAGGWEPPPELAPKYIPMRTAARRAAMLCNIVSATVIFSLLTRIFGIGTGLFSLLILSRHYLFGTYFAAAHSDPVLAAATTAAALPLWSIWSARDQPIRRLVRPAVASGVLSAAAFLTRQSGLLVLGVSAVVIAAAAWRHRSLRVLALIPIVVAVCAVLGIASNPYYWAVPRDEGGLRKQFLARKNLPARVIDRFEIQVGDLRRLLEEHEPYRLRTIPGRVRFVGGVLISGTAGLVILAGSLLAAVAVFNSATRHAMIFVWIWTAVLVTGLTVWIPLRWDSYILSVLPAMVLLAGSGFGWLTTLPVFARSTTSTSRAAGDGRQSGTRGS